jgi:hypothetical protein
VLEGRDDRLRGLRLYAEPMWLGGTSVSERGSLAVAASCVRLRGSEVADSAKWILVVGVLSEAVTYEPEETAEHSLRCLR